MKTLIENINETPGQFQEMHGKSHFLGSSEIATAAGLNKFQSPIDLFMRKSGRDTSVIDNTHTRLGKKMEQVVAETFIEDKPTFELEKCNSTFQDDTIPWAVCTPDYFLHEPGTCEKQLLEIKTSGVWARNDWLENRVPDYAHIQLQWQMGICGIEKGYLAALIGGKEFYSKEIKFSSDVFKQLVELGSKFLDLVKSDTMPDVRWDDNLNFIRPVEKEIELPESKEMIEEFLALQSEISESNSLIKLKEQALSTIKNKLILKMQSANLARCGRYTIQRKIIPIKGSVRQPSEQIRFSIKEEK